MADYALDVKKVGTIREYLYRPDTIKQLNNVLPKFMNAERFLRTFYTAMLRNPALHDCTVQSMLSAMIDCAALGLEPVMGKAALVPYGNQVQFQPMYRGLIELARRTGNIIISAHNVHQNDQFDIEFGDNERIIHKPVFTNRGEIIGAYTVWTFPDGLKSKTFMPIEDIHKIRDRSKAWKRAKANPNDDRAQQTPWVTDPGEMNIKTVIKRHSKLQPSSIEVDYAVQHDDHVEYGALPPARSLLLPELNGADGLPQAEVATDSFEKSIPEGTNRLKLDEYLKMCAESFGFKSVQDFKQQVVEDGSFDQFWSSFAEWLKPLKKGRPKKAEPMKEQVKNPSQEDLANAFNKTLGGTMGGEEEEPSDLLTDFLEQAEKMLAEIEPDAKEMIFKLYGMVGKPLKEMAPGYWQAFLNRCSKQLDIQNAKKK